MPYESIPTYNILTDFSDDEANLVAGRSTVRTANLDTEHVNIKAVLDALSNNLLMVQRTDGRVKDAFVEPHGFSASALALIASTFTPLGDWATATAYVVGNIVEESGNSYVCVEAHTSGTFATDHAAEKWVVLATIYQPVDETDTDTTKDKLVSNNLMKTLEAWRNLMTTRGDMIYRDASGNARLGKGTAGQILKQGANDPYWANESGGLVCEGRLTLETGVAVSTSDQTAKATLYFTPHKGNRIALYDGSVWEVFNLSEISIALSGGTASKPHDVFVYDNSGTLTLELVAWTDDTNRATALAVQSGIYVQTSASNKRYLGTLYLDGSKQCADSEGKRHLWNYYNRVPKPMRNATETTNSWTYSTASFRQANANAANQIECVIGVAEDMVKAEVIGIANNSVANEHKAVGVGINSTSVNSSQELGTTISVDTLEEALMTAKWSGFLSAGRNYLAWLEKGAGTGTTTWIGDNGIAFYQTGIRGEVFA